MRFVEFIEKSHLIYSENHSCIFWNYMKIY